MAAMSNKEKLARGSAEIKAMKAHPRAGYFLKSYVNVKKLPKQTVSATPKTPQSLALLEMPHLDIKKAFFIMDASSAKIRDPTVQRPQSGTTDPCYIPPFEDEDNIDVKALGLPDKHYLLKWFGYREWADAIYKTDDSNLAEHFNILLGFLMSMAGDTENENFPDAEAYPCVQFLRTIRTPDGEVPANIANLITYIDYICYKMIEE